MFVCDVNLELKWIRVRSNLIVSNVALARERLPEV